MLTAWIIHPALSEEKANLRRWWWKSPETELKGLTSVARTLLSAAFGVGVGFGQASHSKLKEVTQTKIKSGG
jgi:hypothetical protein